MTNQALIIFAAATFAGLGILVGSVAAAIRRFLKEWFDDRGRQSEGRRRLRSFAWCVEAALGCLYYCFVLQVMRGLPLERFPEVSKWLTVAQIVLALLGFGFGKAAWNRVRDPFAY